jgi:hypothetical protein
LATGAFLLHPLTLTLGWSVNSDAPYTAGLSLFFSSLLSGAERMKTVVAGALCLGLACYFREAGLGAAFGAAVVYAGRKRRSWPLAAGLLIGVFAPLVPWMVRNAGVTGLPTPGTQKTATLFFASSLGLDLSEVNPFSFERDGRIDYGRIRARMQEYFAAHPPQRGATISTAYLLEHGALNYLAHPWRQAQALALRLANLLRPMAAQRHLNLALSRNLSTFVYWALFLVHVALVLGGLGFALFGSVAPVHPLRGSLIATIVGAMFLWCEPRYLYPLYPLLFAIAIEGGRQALHPTDSGAPPSLDTKARAA